MIELSADLNDGGSEHRTFESRQAALSFADDLLKRAADIYTAHAAPRRMVLSTPETIEQWTSSYGWDDARCAVCNTQFAFDRDSSESKCSCGRAL